EPEGIVEEDEHVARAAREQVGELRLHETRGRYGELGSEPVAFGAAWRETPRQILGAWAEAAGAIPAVGDGPDGGRVVVPDHDPVRRLGMLAPIAVARIVEIRFLRHAKAAERMVLERSEE